MDENDCKEAANVMGRKYNGRVYSERFPSGCIGASTYIAFNENKVGARDKGQYQVCYKTMGKFKKIYIE